LRVGLSIVLTFIGVKMLIVIAHVEIPIWLSLCVVIGVLLLSVFASLVWPRQEVRATHVKLEGGSTPVFELSGSGILCHFVIYGAKPMPNGDEETSLLWEIEPTDGYAKGRAVESVGQIEYGVVPPGYKQIYPTKDAA